MEAVHRLQKRPWISDVISVRKFLSDWKTALLDVQEILLSEDDRTWKEQFMRELDIQDKKVLQTLSKDCGPECLSWEGEKDIEYAKSTFDIPPGVNLQCLNFQKQDLLKRNAMKPYRIATHKNFRYHNHVVNKVKQNADDNGEFKEIEMPEVVLTIQVYRPKRLPQRDSKYRRRKMTLYVEDEISVLGSQKLTKLAERISCVSDICIPGDFSENPNVDEAMLAREVYHSGFFYINGTFYNDTSRPENRDYSKVILDWAKDPSRGIGPFKTCLMQETTFLDLELQLGYPYVYQHQGDCEHLIVFSDLRILHPNDERNEHSYPKFESVFPRARVVCMVCFTETAKWVTFDNNRLPENPFFFCERCFLSFNYTIDRKKIGNFRAQPYFDRTAML